MYTEKGNHLAFFVPLITLAQNAAEVLKEQDIGASSADHGELVCVKACAIQRVGFVLTSELAGGTSVAPRVIFTHRPTPLSATSEVIVGTVIVPDATAVGKCVFKDVEPYNVKVGETIELSHVVGTGTPTGQGVYFFECQESEEDYRNNSDMILSA